MSDRSDRYRPRVPRYAARHEIRGVTYHVNLWGDREAPLLVLLHGWGDAGSTFQFVVDALRNDWFVVAPDWRGFGKSHHRTYGYWFPDYLADLHELLAISLARQGDPPAAEREREKAAQLRRQ